MERDRWERAIRCLEVALHPNTDDDEVIAGVNGFRRTAGGTPLSAVCAAFAEPDRSSRDQAAAVETTADLDRENRDLRRRLDREQAGRATALRRLHEAERLVRELAEEIRAEKENFADFRAASAEIVEGLKDENFDLRAALEQRRLAPLPSARTGSSPFRDVLTAARRRDDPEAIGTQRGGSATTVPPMPRHPWTA
jgi:hypothetical protein